MSRLVTFDRLISPLVKPRIVVRDVTGGTAHPAKVPPPVAAFDPNVTALAIRAKVGINGFPGILFKRFHVGLGDLDQF